MKTPVLYRKRLIPDECILLNDLILRCDDTHIVTSWNALRARDDLHHGFSCYFLKEGFKLSRFCREDGSLLHWYFDIVEYDYQEATNVLTVTDLLADVIIEPDGFVKVVDLDELVQASDEGRISTETLKESLLKLNHLLTMIYSGKFPELQSYLPDPEGSHPA